MFAPLPGEDGYYGVNVVWVWCTCGVGMVYMWCGYGVHVGGYGVHVGGYGLHVGGYGAFVHCICEVRFSVHSRMVTIPRNLCKMLWLGSFAFCKDCMEESSPFCQQSVCVHVCSCVLLSTSYLVRMWHYVQCIIHHCIHEVVCCKEGVGHLLRSMS